MAIVKTDVPMTYALCRATVLALTAAYPACRTEVLTQTAYGREVRTLVIGNGPRRVLYTAAHHANEWITTPVLLKFVEELAAAVEGGGLLYGVDGRYLAELATVHTVPMVDPDGVDLVTGAAPEEQVARAETLARRYPDIPFPDGWKANLLGVDLNLQYPARWLRAREVKYGQGYRWPGPRDFVGRAPLDQWESRALAGYTEYVDPDLVLAYHTQGGEIYWQFEGYPVPGARELGELFAQVSGYTLADPADSSGYAGYKDWFIKTFRRPGFTVEAGRGVNPLPLAQFDEIYRDNLGILTLAALG